MAGRRQALIIAVSQYDDPHLPQLKAPEHDAKALSQVLSDDSIGGFEVTASINESAHEIRESFEEFFSESKPDDLKLVYFSGHGIKDSNGQLYFATKNTKSSRLQSTAISAKFFNDIIHESRSRKKVLILDCCFSGAFAKDMVFRAGSNVGTKEYFNEGKGHLVITASDAMQFAHDADKNEAAPEPSIFTRTLVEGLRSGEADRDQDGKITFDELYEYLHDKVTEKMPGQEPCKWAFQVKGDLVIAKNPKPVAIALPGKLTDLINHERPECRLIAVNDLEKILAGKHKGLAKAALHKLEILVDNDSKKVAAAAQKVIEMQSGNAGIVTPIIVIEERKAEHRPVEEKTNDFKKTISSHVVKKQQVFKKEQSAGKHVETKAKQKIEKKAPSQIKQEVPVNVENAPEHQKKNSNINKKSAKSSYTFVISFVVLGVLVLISVLVLEPEKNDSVYKYTQPAVINEKSIKRAVIPSVVQVMAVKPIIEPKVEPKVELKELPKVQPKIGPVGKLTIKTIPADALVKILNIGEAYYPGIELEVGPYDVEITKEDYRMLKKIIYVEAGGIIEEVILDESGSLETFRAIPSFNMVKKARDFFDNKDYENSFVLYKYLAINFYDSESQFYLGWMCANGKGVLKNEREAVKWFRRAAERGSASSQNALANMYNAGSGVLKNEKEAVKWYRKAAEQGNAEGQVSLGGMYELGKGVTRDESEAIKWYRKSALQDYGYGQYRLGFALYDERFGWNRLTQSYNEEAVKWLRTAADQGIEAAEVKLREIGAVYEDPEDFFD